MVNNHAFTTSPLYIKDVDEGDPYNRHKHINLLVYAVHNDPLSCDHFYHLQKYIEILS